MDEIREKYFKHFTSLIAYFFTIYFGILINTSITMSNVKSWVYPT